MSFSYRDFESWSVLNLNEDFQRDWYQLDCIKSLDLPASRVASSCRYEAVRYFKPGCVIHSHAGHITDTIVDFICRGGMFTSRWSNLPFVMASRCAHSTSICQLLINCVVGSMIVHPWRMNSKRLRRACSARTKASGGSFAGRGGGLGDGKPSASLAGADVDNGVVGGAVLAVLAAVGVIGFVMLLRFGKEKLEGSQFFVG